MQHRQTEEGAHLHVLTRSRLKATGSFSANRSLHCRSQNCSSLSKARRHCRHANAAVHFVDSLGGKHLLCKGPRMNSWRVALSWSLPHDCQGKYVSNSLVDQQVISHLRMAIRQSIGSSAALTARGSSLLLVFLDLPRTRPICE